MSKKKTVKKSEAAEKPKTRGGTHPKHPPCPECGRAMYKTMTVGKAVKKDDPWAFCRNKDCGLFGKNQVEGVEPEDGEEVASKAIEETAFETIEEIEVEKPKVEKATKKASVSAGKRTPLTKEQKKARRKLVVADLLSEEFSHSEIAKRNKCSRKYVKSVSLKIQSEG